MASLGHNELIGMSSPTVISSHINHGRKKQWIAVFIFNAMEGALSLKKQVPWKHWETSEVAETDVL